MNTSANIELIISLVEMQKEVQQVPTLYYKSRCQLVSYKEDDAVNHTSGIRYRDLQDDAIEKENQKGKKYVVLDEYYINFKKLLQTRLNNNIEQEPVYGVKDHNSSTLLRPHRFGSKPILRTLPKGSSTFGEFYAWSPFLQEWFSTPKGKRSLLDFSKCIEACAEGIIKEAHIHSNNSNDEVIYMAEKILECRGRTREETSEICIHFYTKDSFLYDALNTALRNCDVSKVETLGPYAFLIYNYTRTHHDYIGTVYRGVQLSDSDIENYKRAIGTWKTWPAITSTSKARQIAEIFGNTLFVIEITDQPCSSARTIDISGLSMFPAEQEVLMMPGLGFKIMNVFENIQKKYIVNIQI